MIIPVLLAGGSGTRLWPLSRKQQPKQFINLLNDKTPFQNTILRLPNGISSTLVICNENHRFLAAEQLRQINHNSKGIILEKNGKNTAPAIALASLQLLDDDPLLLVLPADHHIENINKFHEAIHIAEDLAKKNLLVTFGVIPTHAETGYGYIKANIVEQKKYYSIESFIEKPNLEESKLFLESDNYLWNSGMFMFKASTYLNELEKFEPNIIASCKKSLASNQKDMDFIRLSNKDFEKCPDISIDYAVMEHTKKSAVVPLDAGWSDLGSWQSLMNAKDKDIYGNVLEGDINISDTKNSYILSSNRLISAIGVSDLIVVDSQDALLISKMKDAQNIGSIVKQLQLKNRPEADHHRKVYRPWGYYDSIDFGKEFQVKRILVEPGKKLSLQKHHHRAEHWIIVRGVAKITRGKETFSLQQNQSTYISKGQIHRLENEQKTPLEVIEVQTGEYLGEDDIIRFDDDYQRN
jgi:mannose-1-phosphate guanylyltransferase/mannose-6-phosphate isomerase